MLSVRDPEAWEKSLRDTIWDVLLRPVRHGTPVEGPRARRPRLARLHRADEEDVGRPGRLQRRRTEAAAAGGRHRPLPGVVQRNIPRDRLLVWNVAEGWEPLCRFLEVDVPETPFPRLDDSKMFIDRIIDGALVVLKEWRARGGAVGKPAQQPA